MAILANSRLYVERPGALVPRYGLFNVANGPLDLPPHARAVVWNSSRRSATCRPATRSTARSRQSTRASPLAGRT